MQVRLYVQYLIRIIASSWLDISLTFAYFVQNTIIRFVAILKSVFREHPGVFESGVATVHRGCFGLQKNSHGLGILQTTHSSLEGRKQNGCVKTGAYMNCNQRWPTDWAFSLTSIAISLISCLVLLLHTAGTVSIHEIESKLSASEHRSVSSSKIKYLRCRKASVIMRTAGRDTLLAAIM